MFWFIGHKACLISAPQAGDWTCTPCIGRCSLNHWTTREDPGGVYVNHLFNVRIPGDPSTQNAR